MRLIARVKGKNIEIEESDIPLIVNSLAIPKPVKEAALFGVKFPMSIKEGGKVLFACRERGDSRKQSLASRAALAMQRMSENRQS